VSNELPHRGLLTDSLLEHLETEMGQLDMLVGDHLAPEEAGWTGGQPQRGHYRSYVTVRTGEGIPRERDTAAATHSSWTLTYTLLSVGAVREQCDYTADMVRRACLSFETAPEGWRIVHVGFTRLGAVNRNDSTDPPTYECTDSVQVWLDRRRR
jgi:hypothetical protein